MLKKCCTFIKLFFTTDFVIPQNSEQFMQVDHMASLAMKLLVYIYEAYYNYIKKELNPFLLQSFGLHESHLNKQIEKNFKNANSIDHKIDPENLVPFSLGNEMLGKNLQSKCVSEPEEIIFVQFKHCLSSSYSPRVLSIGDFCWQIQDLSTISEQVDSYTQSAR